MRFTVEGQSMRPFLRDLDVCVSEKVSPAKIFPGDLVLYDSEVSAEVIVHRIIKIDKRKSVAFIKGDNEPGMDAADRVPLEDIMGKVLFVERGSRVFDLNKRWRKICAGIIAFLSLRDLTPLVAQRRFLSPLVLAVSGNGLYKIFRERFYAKLQFCCVKKEGYYKVFSYLGRSMNAEAFLQQYSEGHVTVSSYIKYRDRNSGFARIFLEKILKVVDEKYGKDSCVHILEGEFKELISGCKEVASSERVYL
ncbi:MAG: signal peptidase I [Candidatus Omnitrophica bacterium]|nr:signal peptidase I [Candidatus Omnitrophota bacterium]